MQRLLTNSRLPTPGSLARLYPRAPQPRERSHHRKTPGQTHHRGGSWRGLIVGASIRETSPPISQQAGPILAGAANPSSFDRSAHAYETNGRQVHRQHDSWGSWTGATLPIQRWIGESLELVRISTVGPQQARPVDTLPTSPYLAVKAVMMPRDTNPVGTIFGGVVLSYIDQAGAVGALHEIQQAGWPRHVIVTVALNTVEFHQPVFVGDIVSFWTRVLRVGTTSITIHVSVEA